MDALISISAYQHDMLHFGIPYSTVRRSQSYSVHNVRESSRVWEWRWPLYLIKDRPSRSLWGRLLDKFLSPLHIQHSHHSPPVQMLSGLPLKWRPQSWGAMPSICQLGDCFSALEILAWKINVAAGLRHPSSGRRGPEGGEVRVFFPGSLWCV